MFLLPLRQREGHNEIIYYLSEIDPKSFTMKSKKEDVFRNKNTCTS